MRDFIIRALLLILPLTSVNLRAENIALNTPLAVTPGIRGAVELTFPSTTNVYYQVDFSTDLAHWDPEGYSAKGTGGTVTVLVSTRNQPAAYYRLRNDGDPLNAAPKGPLGPIGPIGPTGGLGLTGVAGLVGPTGPNGLQGIQGLQGVQGPQGIPGTGSASGGQQGPIGPQGPQGSIGPQGLIGPVGVTGQIGPLGPTGSQGPTGQPPLLTGSLGIDYYDDFSGKSSGTVIGSNYQPDYGTPYVFYLGGGAVPSVTDGTLSAPTPSAWYLGQQLKNPVRTFGTQVRFDSQNAASGGYDVAVFLIMPENIFLDKLIHIRFSRIGLGVDISTGGGVSGFVNLLSINHANYGGGGNGIPPIGQTQTLTGTIINDTLWLNWLGRTYKVKDPRIAAVNGKWIFFEQYSPEAGNSDYVKWLRVWANSPDISALPGVGVRSASGSPSSLIEAFGQGQFERKLLVGSSDATMISGSNDYTLFVRGTSEVQRLIANRNKGFTTVVGGTSWVSTNAVGNTAGSALNSITSTLFFGGSLLAAGDRWEGKYMGTFAANSHIKRVAFEMAGGLPFDSGNLTNTNEPWELTATIYRSSTVSHNAFFKFITPTKTLMSTVELNYGNATTIGVGVKAAGSSANDVILKYGQESYYPAP